VSATLRFFAAEENRLLNLASGPTGRYLAKLAVMVETGAKQRCPVDTGRLRSSITWRLEQPPLTAIVGSNVEYSAFVELGTRRMAARPYLVPALHSVVG
jgi:phage gpG-like protein